MKSLLVLLVVSLFCPSYAVLQECDPPVQDCKCDVKVLKCDGCRNFPTQFPLDTEEFIFERCNFDTEVKDLPYTKAVTLLILDSPDLAVYKGAFKNLANLSTLQIHQSNLRELRADMFEGLSALKILSLEGNAISTVPAVEPVFASMPALEELTLSDNDMLSITPGSFSGLDALQKLELSECGLTEVPVSAIKDLSTLNVLDLSFNKFASVPGKAFEKLESLQKLQLGQNDVVDLEEEAFEGLKSLLELDLSYNALRELHEDLLDDSDKLKKLNIKGNQLTTVPDDLVEWRGVELQMSENPWACDCTNYWMQELQFSPTENITCASPVELEGHNLHNATMSLECDVTSRSTIVMAVIIPLMVICTCLIIYFVYKMIQTKKRRDGQRNVRYSSVYKDTVETVSGGKKGKPMPEL